MTQTKAYRASVHSKPSNLRILRVWYLQELLLLIREPVAVFFSLAFPLIIYIFIGIPYAESTIPHSGIKFIDAMFSSLVGTVGANLLIMGLPIYLAELRTRQVTKRYSMLPLPGSIFGAAIIGAMLTLTIFASAIIIAVIGIRHGLRSEATSPIYLLLFLGLLAFLCGLGFFLGTLPFGSRTVQALSAAVFFIMFFGSGAAAPLDSLPEFIKTMLEWNPLKIWFDAMVNVYTGMEVKGESFWKIALTLLLSLGLGAVGIINWRRTD